MYYPSSLASLSDNGAQEPSALCARYEAVTSIPCSVQPLCSGTVYSRSVYFGCAQGPGNSQENVFCLLYNPAQVNAVAHV